MQALELIDRASSATGSDYALAKQTDAPPIAGRLTACRCRAIHHSIASETLFTGARRRRRRQGIR